MIKKMLACGELHILAGFESNRQDGKSCILNFILSNGETSNIKDKKHPTNYKFMI